MAVSILHIAVSRTIRTDLAQAASAIFRCLGILEFEERESTNYISGRYFSAAREPLSFQVTVEDDQGFDDYDFWLVLTLPVESRHPMNDLVMQTAEKLLGCGFGVSQEDTQDPERSETKVVRTVYSLERSGPAPKVEKRRELIPIDQVSY
jgi:hypothetical protein